MNPTDATPPPAVEPAASADAKRASILAVTSGKGGVGKTFLSANLAAAFARRGERVLVLDADLGLANLDVVLNLVPKITLHDVFTGKAALEDAIVPAPGAGSPAPDAGDQLLWDLLAAKPDLLLVTGDKALQRDAAMRSRELSPQAFADGP